MVFLTLAISIAAFWSAYIFQGQLTVARETMESQTRPWIGIENDLSGWTSDPFMVKLRNYGPSPAISDLHNIVFWLIRSGIPTPKLFDSYKICEESARAGFAIGGESQFSSVIFPGVDNATVL